MIDPERPAILHVCKREMLRSLRDDVLRHFDFVVDSTLSIPESLEMFSKGSYALVLIDVEEHTVEEAEQLCSDIKTARHEQLVAFVCNWRVAFQTDCPDEILRTEFDPAAFVAGVRKMLAG